MFFIELKPAPNTKDIYEVEYLQQCKIKFEPLKHKRDIAKCAVKDMGTQKIIATLNQDVSMVPVIIRQSSANVKKDRVMFDVPSVVEIIPRITRDVRSTKTFKGNPTHSSVPKSTLLQHNFNKPYIRNLELLMLK
jgi:hypothetical protein